MPGKRKSAFSVAMREAQTHNGETVEQQRSETVESQYGETPERLISNTVTQQSRKTVSPYEKVSFYITAEQSIKLDDLAHEFRRAYGKRINRNDIVRHLLDQASLSALQGMDKDV